MVGYQHWVPSGASLTLTASSEPLLKQPEGAAVVRRFPVILSLMIRFAGLHLLNHSIHTHLQVRYQYLQVLRSLDTSPTGPAECGLQWKVAPALAAGNTAILKPSEHASVTSLELAAIAQAVGLPAGVLNVVTGLGVDAGAPLSSHPGVAKVPAVFPGCCCC